MGIDTTESGLSVVTYPRPKAGSGLKEVVSVPVAGVDGILSDTENGVLQPQEASSVSGAKAKVEAEREPEFWKDKLTPKEREYYNQFQTVANFAGSYQNQLPEAEQSPELNAALEIDADLEDRVKAAAAQYNDETGDFVRPNPDYDPADPNSPETITDNYSRHARVIIEVVEQALASGGRAATPELEKALKVLRPRLKDVVDENGNAGYEIDSREVRNNQSELTRDSFDMMTEMLGLVDANELYKTNPDLYGKIFGVWTMLYNGRRSPANALPAQVQLQLVHEVVGLVNTPDSGANLDFSWQRIDKDGNASAVRARNIASEVGIAYKVSSENGQRNLAAEWFVDQAVEMGITATVDDKPMTVKGNEVVFVEMLSKDGTTGIDMFTGFEGVLHTQVIAGDNKIGTFFKDKLGIDIGARFKKYDNPLFRAMAQNSELTGRVGRKVFGDRGFTQEWLEQVKQLTGIDMAKRLDRLEKNGFNVQAWGMGTLLLYNAIGPLMSMDEEPQEQ